MRAAETTGPRRSRSADRDAVAPVAVDPVEALLDVGAGLLGQQVAWEPGRGAVAEARALCERQMRLEPVENRVRTRVGLKRLQHHDAQRHRTSVAPPPRAGACGLHAEPGRRQIALWRTGAPRRGYVAANSALPREASSRVRPAYCA